MNTLKLVCFSALIFVLGSCTKDKPTDNTVESTVLCANITLTIKSLLPNDLEDFTIGNTNFGTIGSNSTEELCLEESFGYGANPSFLVLFASAIYENEEVYDGYFCGTGLLSVTEGSYEMEITEISDKMIIYNFK